MKAAPTAPNKKCAFLILYSLPPFLIALAKRCHAEAPSSSKFFVVDCEKRGHKACTAAGNSVHHPVRCGIFGRSPLALPVIGGFGSLVRPPSMTKSWSSEYHGP